MTRLLPFALLLALAAPAGAETFREAFPRLTDQIADPYRERVAAIELRHGTLALPGGQVELRLPDGLYALDAADARYVAESAWGNPADETILAMVLATGTTPLDENAWALVLQYDPMGHVSDSDAADIDYDALLAEMKAGTDAENVQRREQGFPEVQVLGWAAPPHYDAVEKKLHWAKRLKFADAPGETLNYNVRVLGREGVLVANFVAGMDQLPAVQLALPAVLSMVHFTAGNRYADFTPGVDQVAAGGIAALIAGKMASKAGLLALLLPFLKKFGVLLALPLIWLGRLFRRKPGAGV
jgi:uncharacterized membrane-anchored protein